jgi:hypothetical protein
MSIDVIFCKDAPQWRTERNASCLIELGESYGECGFREIHQPRLVLPDASLDKQVNEGDPIPRKDYLGVQ